MCIFFRSVLHIFVVYFEYWDGTWDSDLWKENEIKEGTWAELNKPIPILNDKKNRHWLKYCAETKIHHSQKVKPESPVTEQIHQDDLLWEKVKWGWCPEVLVFWLPQVWSALSRHPQAKAWKWVWSSFYSKDRGLRGMLCKFSFPVA